ncbi:hypothetical protein C8J56DRAFT_783575, partial [Mycena floridula]
MAQPGPLPKITDKEAPRFFPAFPQSIVKFFSDFEYAAHIANVMDIREMKDGIVRLLDDQTAKLWKAQSVYANTVPPIANWDQFKSEIMALYPRSVRTEEHSIEEMQRLINDTCRMGIKSLYEFTQYYHNYLLVTEDLKARDQISLQEQLRGFARGFQPELWARLYQVLFTRDPTHDPGAAWTIAEIKEAVEMVLYGTAVSAPHIAVPSLPMSMTN